jgi:hypothetical protein
MSTETDKEYTVQRMATMKMLKLAKAELPCACRVPCYLACSLSFWLLAPSLSPLFALTKIVKCLKTTRESPQAQFVLSETLILQGFLQRLMSQM